MRIVHVNHRDPKHPLAGGLEELIVQISRHWVKEGHEVYQLCSGHKELCADETVDSIQYHRVGREEFFNFIAAKELKQWPPKKPDIILEHISKIPCYLPGQTNEIPMAVHVPHLFGSSVYQEANPVVASYVRLMEARIGKVYQHCPFWALCPSTKAELVNRGIPGNNIQVISGGVDTKTYVPGEENCKTSHPSLIYVGRLKKYKGIAVLVEAMKFLLKEFPTAQLTITGRGNYLPELKAVVGRAGVSANVTFAGFVDVQTKIKLLQESWILLYPSPKEGWGLSVIEAGACNTPTIASNSPGLRDSVVDQHTGLLVSHKNADEWVLKITSLLRDSERRFRMAEAAYQHAQKFDWKLVADEALEFLSRSIQKYKSSGV